jgi:CBS domain-containing protein
VPMAHTRLDQAAGLTVGDVVHRKFSALPADATIADVRAWFAASTSRRMAFLADDEHYAGSLTPEDVDGDLDPARPAADVAHSGPTVLPEAPAAEGEQLALRTAARRVPVVDRDGRLLGVVSVTEDLQAFCGTADGPAEC